MNTRNEKEPQKHQRMKNHNKPPVVIIGAGLSGLLTAYRLKKAGIEIKVLEARSRAGGRINTIREVEDTPLEMGATWFGPQHQNLRNLLEELRLSGFKQYMEGSVVFEASPLSPPQEMMIPPQDPSFRIKGGTGNLVDTLLNFFSVGEIIYNEQVKQILIEDKGVKVKTNNTIFSAKKVVCCIPPALLVNSVKFVPELPQQFLSEARQTHTWMQESIKAGVVYKNPFWKAKKVSTIASIHGPVIEYYDHSDFENSKFALCGFLHPDYVGFEKEEREKRVIAQLKRLLGEEAGEYIDYKEVLWQKEKFTHAPTGETFLPHQNNGNKIFQEPLYGGKILVSNSETSAVSGGYMEGAVFSANLVAKNLIKE